MRRTIMRSVWKTPPEWKFVMVKPASDSSWIR